MKATFYNSTMKTDGSFHGVEFCATVSQREI